MTIEEIIQQSSFKVIVGDYIYAKVKDVPRKSHFMITQDPSEITVVTTKNRIDELALIEKNKDFYNLICLNVSVPFYSVGFLSKVSTSIANAGLNILIVSTYSKDYILIKSSSIKVAIQTLRDLGFQEER